MRHQPPTKEEAQKLIRVYDSFRISHGGKGIDEAFVSFLDKNYRALKKTYQHFVQSVSDSCYRRRILKGRVRLYYKCRHCKAAICKSQDDCGCRLEKAKSLIAQNGDWLVKGQHTKNNLVTSLTVECLHCHSTVRKFLGSLAAGASCPCQKGKKIARTRLQTFGHSEYAKRLQRRNIKVTLLSSYQGMNRKIRFRCLECNTESESYAGNVLKGKGCYTCGRVKIQANCLAAHGVRFHTQRESVQKKMRKTMLRKFGCEHALQNKELFLKQQKKALGRRPYKLGDQTVFVQGYEPLALDWVQLHIGIDPSDILCGSKKEIPSIRYYWQRKTRIYYPDFYVPSRNAIVEVKSTYSYQMTKQQVIAKAKACKDAGYKFILMVMNPDGTRNYDYQGD